MNISKTLWYKKPAECWDEALPLGNGRIGAMVFSQPLCERIQLNEDSIWSGGYRERNNLSALPNLQKVRNLLFEEKISRAEKIIYDAFCGTPENQRHYMPLGDINISHFNESSAVFISRQLDLEKAVCTTEYKINDVEYKREIFISAPDNVFVMRISASQMGKISIRIKMDGRDDYFDDNSPVKNNDIMFYGGCGSEDGINFAAYLKAINKGGKIYSYGSFISCENCDEVILIMGAQTSYRFENYKQQAVSDVLLAEKLGWKKLLTRHIKDYKRYFDRAEISLCDNSSGNSKLPTDERLHLVKNGNPDNKLIEMYHNFGRYLLISCSRENTLPANLQGIWNKDMMPPWGCKFTININTEMNYWCAENCNLSELHIPLFDHIEKLRPNGRKTAEIMYNCKGFVCHHNTDIWGDTAPQDLWIPGTQWPMGGAWLCLHIWEHYLYTLDKDFLKEKYETIKESAEFFMDFLIEDAKGRLVTCPSVSPENTYITKSGEKGSVCIAPSMDSQILYSLFTAVISSSEILDTDHEFAKRLESARNKLPKTEIGKYGQIKEWAEDYDEAEPGHRHISQLFALYPSDMISMRKTPQLASAAKATLERRLSHGGGHTGWSRAWIINHWARLFDGEKVYENIIALLSNSTNINMFDMHPPFQIDGNFGGTAGITEALLQSENSEIILLPALPLQWNEGSFRGLCARGGFVVNCSWKDKKIISCNIHSNADEICRIVCSPQTEVTFSGKAVETSYCNGAIEFQTQKGSEYSVNFR